MTARCRSEEHEGAHHKALPYSEVGAALAAVVASTAGETVKAAIKFVVLTACRSGEVRGATWGEVNVQDRVVDGSGRADEALHEHRAPLSLAALQVLRDLEPHRDRTGLVFPSAQGRVLSASTLLKAWQAATGTDTSLHGSGRASFRTWAAERTDTTRDIAEMALGHVVGSDIERSYARSDLFERRRGLMDQWSEFGVVGGE